jgi:hypothetical protein
MRKFVILSVLILLGAVTASADTVVTFDDLTGQALVPNGYGGINWNGNWTYYGFVQSPYTPKSGPNRVFDLSPSGDTFSFLTPEVFEGAFFSGFSSATVKFNLFNGANLVWTSATLAPNSTPTFLSSGYSGMVTKVEVSSPVPDFFVMDNVTYATGSTTVSEPSSLLLLGAGLLGSAGILRRKLGR